MREKFVQGQPVGPLREWWRRIKEGWEILGPVRGPVLLITHAPVLVLEWIICDLVKARLGHFPFAINCPRPRADVIIAVGLSTTPYSVYPMGIFLRWVFRYRVLFLQTPLAGNVVSSRDMVDLNEVWVRALTGQRPLYAIGFSYGGFDLIWQMRRLLEQSPSHPARVLYTINTPLRGSALARVIKVSGAREMDQGCENLERTQCSVDWLLGRGMRVHHGCSFVDLVARKSDTRLERVPGHQVPTRWQRYVLWPLKIALTLGRWKPTLPSWWSHTYPQIGHKATMNPLVWLTLGLRVMGDLRAQSNARD